MSTFEANAYGATSFETRNTLEPFTIKRREPKSDDVHIEIKYCGICHSDVHQIRSEWPTDPKNYQDNGGLVVGHEIVGIVARVGDNVTNFKPGDYVAVGCLVGGCNACHEHPIAGGINEQYCPKSIGTYCSPDVDNFGFTKGGYSTDIVVNKDYVVRVPQKYVDNNQLAEIAPILCAFITTYTPLKRAGIKKGDKVGVAGFGGLGCAAIKLAVAMGCDVTLFTTSENKIEDAKRLGCEDVILSKDVENFKRIGRKFDLIIDTISAPHNIDNLLSCIVPCGSLALVGASPTALQFMPFQLILPSINLFGSLIGNIADTQSCIDFCAEHNITMDIEKIPADYINTAYERLLKSDVKYRFVIDIDTLREKKE
jgi:uncharacterized zinc-type alcohol dehydrogenase-like protein